MMSSLIHVLVLFFAVSLISCEGAESVWRLKQSESNYRFCDTPFEEIKAIVKTVDGIIGYIEENVNKLNLDGASCLSMSEGALLPILNMNVSSATKHFVSTLLVRLNSVAKRASRILLSSGDPYAKHFLPLLTGPFLFRASWHKLNRTVRSSATFKELQDDVLNYREDVFDTCYNEVMGTAGNTRCTVSQKCLARALSTSTGNMDYFLTHKILYLLFLKTFKCDKQLPRTWVKTIARTSNDFCSLALDQHEVFLKEGLRHGVNMMFRDLFLEQAVVCGLLGFVDFFKFPNMRFVRGYQDKVSGCYGFHTGFRSRKLLSDSLMPGSCSSHETGLAAAYFSISLNSIFYDTQNLCKFV